MSWLGRIRHTDETDDVSAHPTDEAAVFETAVDAVVEETGGESAVAAVPAAGQSMPDAPADPLDAELAVLRGELVATLPEDAPSEVLAEPLSEMPDLESSPFAQPVPGIFGPGAEVDPAARVDRRRLSRILVVVGLLIVLVGGVLVYNLAIRPLVRVPDLVGASSTAAVQRLNARGLILGDLSEKAVAGVEDGTVLDQDPKVDARVRKGSKVALVVAKAGNTARVPDMKTLTETQAQKALISARLVADIEYTFSDAVLPGHVVGQLPAADTVMPSTSKVTVLISKGTFTRQIVNPKVLGLEPSAAEELLRAKGLTPKTYYASTGFGTPGEVVVQTPASKTAVDPLSPVQLLVSRDKAGANLAVPQLVGKTKDSAVSTLVKKGLTADVAYVVSNQPVGTVVAQCPISKDTLVRGGDVVGLLVSRGAGPMAAVPNVLDKTLREARSTLQDAGFTVIVVPATDGSTEAQNENNVIAQQFPAGQSSYRSGLPVVLYAPAATQP